MRVNSFNFYIYRIIKEIIENYYNFYKREQVLPETQFEIELGTSSREMLEFIILFEKTFDIKISYDDIDKYVFRSDTGSITVQIVVDYIETQIRKKTKINNFNFI